MGLLLPERVFVVYVPQRAGRDVARLGVDHLSPVAGRVRGVPELEPICTLGDGVLSGLGLGQVGTVAVAGGILVGRGEDGEKDVEELLRWDFV